MLSLRTTYTISPIFPAFTWSLSNANMCYEMKIAWFGILHYRFDLGCIPHEKKLYTYASNIILFKSFVGSSIVCPMAKCINLKSKFRDFGNEMDFIFDVMKHIKISFMRGITYYWLYSHTLALSNSNDGAY